MFLGPPCHRDWGELEPTDVAENEYSVAHGFRNCAATLLADPSCRLAIRLNSGAGWVSRIQQLPPGFCKRGICGNMIGILLQCNNKG